MCEGSDSAVAICVLHKRIVLEPAYGKCIMSILYGTRPLLFERAYKLPLTSQFLAALFVIKHVLPTGGHPCVLPVSMICLK